MRRPAGRPRERDEWHASLDDPGWRRVVEQGLLPWPHDESVEVVDGYWRHLATPQDRSRHQVSPFKVIDDGRIETYCIDTAVPDKQVYQFLRQKYSDSSLEAASHSYRWMQIGYFVKRNRERMHRAGLLERGPTGEMRIPAPVTMALCQLPYTFAFIPDGSEKALFIYDYGLVVDRTLAIAQAYRQNS